jgi:hypothetical protein
MSHSKSLSETVEDGTLPSVLKRAREMTFLDLEGSVRGTETALRVLQAQLETRTLEYGNKMEEFVLNVADGKISKVGKTLLSERAIIGQKMAELMERQGSLRARLLILRHQLERKKDLGVIRVALNARRKEEMRAESLR